VDKELQIKISPDGTINIELMGFNGDGCSKTAQHFIDALGKTIKSDRKPEYYEDKVKDQGCNRNQFGQ